MKLNILVSGKNNQNETSMSEPEYNNILRLPIPKMGSVP